MWNQSATLDCVELAIYILLAPIALLLAIKHGKRAILGYFYLNIFVTIRIVADIISLVDRNHKTPTIADGVVSAIGLSPLLLTLAGFLHEIHSYQISASSPNPSRSSKFLLHIQIFFHLASAAGLALLVVGTVDLVEDESPSDGIINHSDINSDNHKREGGAIVLLIVWLALLTYALYIALRIKRTIEASFLKLSSYILCTLVAALFIGVRVLYTVVYCFDHNSKKLSPINGSFAIKLVLVVLVQLIAAIAFIVGGWITRNLKKDATRRYNDSDATVERVGQKYQMQPPQGQQQGYEQYNA